MDSCTTYFLVKILLVKEPSHFSMLESKLWHNKIETTNVKVAKDGGIYQNLNPIPSHAGFILIILFQLYNSLPLSFCWGKQVLRKCCSEWMTNFRLIWTWGRVLLGGLSKNDQTQFFDSQMYSPVIFNNVNLKPFPNHGGTSLRENSRNILIFWRNKPLYSRHLPALS